MRTGRWPVRDADIPAAKVFVFGAVFGPQSACFKNDPKTSTPTHYSNIRRLCSIREFAKSVFDAPTRMPNGASIRGKQTRSEQVLQCQNSAFERVCGVVCSDRVTMLRFCTRLKARKSQKVTPINPVRNRRGATLVQSSNYCRTVVIPLLINTWSLGITLVWL